MLRAKPTKHWRRWLRFSLRTLLVVMTLFAVVCGFVMKQARDQRLAVAEILDSGGRILYDFEPDEFEHFRRQMEKVEAMIAGKPMPPPYVDEPWEPRWLLDVVGLDCFHRVKQVALLGPRATDSTMEQVTRLSGVKHLGLYNTSVTDAGFTSIARLSELEYLTVEKGLITDAGLAHVGRLQHLKHLGLSDVDLTDQGLMHLRGLRRLEYMHFISTGVSENAVEELRRFLPHCRPVAVRP